MSPMLALPERPRLLRVPVVETKTWRPLLRLVGLASITVTFLAASAAPTPLYATYQKAWGFSALTTTVVFGVYALAFLSALLTVGRLSDHIGRRPVLFAGIAGQVLALAIFVDAHSVTALLMARIVQGLATGTAIGAIGAGMLDIDQARGAVANATAPGLGTASGVLLSSFAVQWLPAPTRLVYVVLAGCCWRRRSACSGCPRPAHGHPERGARWSRRSHSPPRPADPCSPPPRCSSPCGPSPASMARSDRA